MLFVSLPARHQVMDELSGMDRDLEVGGGANGATPVEDSSSEDLGVSPEVGRDVK